MIINFDGKPDSVEFIDDGYGLTGNLFLVGHEFGWTHLVASDNLADAEDAWLDLQPTIAESELHAAYGYATKEEYERVVEELASDSLVLTEGYLYQANHSGTGIVHVGHYHRIVEVHLSEVKLQAGQAPQDDDAKRIAALDELARTLRNIPPARLAKVVAAGRRAMLQMKHGTSDSP